MALKRRTQLYRNDDCKKFISDKIMANHISMLNLHDEVLTTKFPTFPVDDINAARVSNSSSVMDDCRGDYTPSELPLKANTAIASSTTTTTPTQAAKSVELAKSTRRETFNEINDRLVLESTDDEDDSEMSDNDNQVTLTFSEFLKTRLSHGAMNSPPITILPRINNAENLQLAVYVPRPILVMPLTNYGNNICSPEIKIKNIIKDKPCIDDNSMDITD